ncbi:MAG: acylneuraminate cytidylyltransferase family protein [Bacteroidota bacterium]|nr:acylneuraminate cytidylyltransferase family protein [Bacteroidota bacterium]
MEILAIIPARGGSKGLPGKNIKPLLGHPLIAYSIKAAKESALITRTIVSTDDDAIATVANQYGAEVPFMRPASIAQDLSIDLEVFTHALAWLKEHESYVPDYVIQLRPTSPVRTKGLIDECIHKMFIHPEADSLRIITEAPVTPYKMWTIQDGSDTMQPLLQLSGVEEPFNQLRQTLPKVYWQIGTLDIIKTNVITEKKLMSGQPILHHTVPSYMAVDIDDIHSFEKAANIITQYDCVQF